MDWIAPRNCVRCLGRNSLQNYGGCRTIVGMLVVISVRAILTLVRTPECLHFRHGRHGLPLWNLLLGLGPALTVEPSETRMNWCILVPSVVVIMALAFIVPICLKLVIWCGRTMLVVRMIL